MVDDRGPPPGAVPPTLVTLALNELPEASVMVFDTHLRYVVTRGTALTVNEVDPTYLEGRLASEVLEPARWEFYRPMYEGALQGRATSVQVKSPDGQRSYSVRVSPVVGPDGVVVGGVSMAVDITEATHAAQQLQASEERFRVLAENASDIVVMLAPDDTVSWVSPSVERMLGWSPLDVVGRSGPDFAHPDDAETIAADLTRSVTGKVELDDHRLRTSDGDYVWVSAVAQPIWSSTGAYQGHVVAIRNIDEQVKSRRRVESSEELLHVILDGSPDATTTFGPDLRVEYVNDRVVALSGLSAEAWLGRSMEELGYSASDIAYWSGRIRRVFETGEPDRMQYEVDNAEGHRWYEASLSPQLGPDGAVAHVISTNRDITDRVRAEEALLDRATHDSLTGLANRAVLLDEIARALNSSRRSDHFCALLMFDLDRFKNVNDSLGHLVGDALLKAAAARIESTIRGSDMVARTGGDEFVVVMRDLDDPAEAVSAAWRLVEAFRLPLLTSEGELFTTASIGVAVASGSGRSTDLLREADTAMYAAKAEGRDRVSVFNDDLRDAVRARLEIEGELRQALERGDLAVWYQPEVDLETGIIVAAEALLRWHHSSGEVLSADRFVDVAEETGLILGISRWVLRQACADAVSWNQSDGVLPLTVRVNVSAMQLSQASLLDDVDDALASSGLDPSRLCLEITETTLLRETTVARDNLEGVHDRGIRIAIDDFGTGYASLSYLHRYPIDVVKIDRSFVADIDAGGIDFRLVGGIIALAHHLGLSVTAEGVEREEQADALRSLGCPAAQGYLYARALPADEMGRLLNTVLERP